MRAPDHIGFGLSDKPREASYLPQIHAENFAALMDHLELDRVTLVVHDWGGPISWFWSVKGVKAFERFSAFMGGPIGRSLCREFNCSSVW